MRFVFLSTLIFICCAPTLFAQDTDWGDWKAAPNFPGIQIRVICRIYVRSDGDSEWNYQFRNDYKEHVGVSYRDEKLESTPAHVVFSSPGLLSLDTGEESSVRSVYVNGDCSRKTLYIAVDGVTIGSGRTLVPIGTSGAASGGTSVTAAVVSTNGARAASTNSPSNNPAGGGQNAANSNSAATNPSSKQASRNVNGGSWTCTFVTPNGVSHLSLYFNDDHSMREVTKDDFYVIIEGNNSRWRQNGSTVEWTDLSWNYPWTGTISADGHELSGIYGRNSDFGPAQAYWKCTR
jgi:hypothetical protein